MSTFKGLLLQSMPWLQLLFSLIWLSNLASTDSYFSIYVLIAFFSFFLQIKKECRRKASVSSLIPAVLFSAGTWLANYPLFTTIGDPAFIGRSTSILVNCINSGFSLVGGICISGPVFSFLLSEFPRKSAAAQPFFFKKWLPWAVFCSLAGIHLMHLFLVEFPGNLTEDTFTQISEMVSGSYSNFNTFWHTMFFQTVLSAGYSVFGSLSGAVACFTVLQVLILCFSFTWCLVTMRDLGVPTAGLVVTCLCYGLLPYHMALSVSIWKDVLFAAGTLMTITAWLRLQKGIGSHQTLDCLLLILGGLLFLISRTSGWVIFLVCFAALLLFTKKNQKLKLVMGIISLAGWILLNPALSAMNVAPGDPIESLSIPIQQVSRVIAEGCELTEDEQQLLSRVADLDTVSSQYTDWLSDPMKVELRRKDPAFFEAHFSEYRDLWIRLGMKYPWQYLKAWVDQTRGYWNGGYPYTMYSETIIDNPYGLEKEPIGTPVASLFRLYFGLSRHVILFQPLHSIGLHVWMLLFCFFLMIRKRSDLSVVWLPLVLLVVGLWFGTPVYSCFRYVYPLFVSIPLIVSASLCCGEN